MPVWGERQRQYLRILNRYIGIAAFCAVFSLIYNLFSHGIHSPFMSWLFAWPLALGGLPAGLAALGLLPPADAASDGIKDLYRFGIASVTVASMLKGILEIAGNDSVYTNILMAAGIVMLAAGAASGIFAALTAARPE